MQGRFPAPGGLKDGGAIVPGSFPELTDDDTPFTNFDWLGPFLIEPPDAFESLVFIGSTPRSPLISAINLPSSSCKFLSAPFPRLVGQSAATCVSMPQIAHFTPALYRVRCGHNWGLCPSCPHTVHGGNERRVPFMIAISLITLRLSSSDWGTNAFSTTSTPFWRADGVGARMSTCCGSSSPGVYLPSLRLRVPCPRRDMLHPLCSSIRFWATPRGPIMTPAKL
mmetsp:Transcript_20102/g.28021  ORF Transcript_20102/g.28021 Transcript_20102/m.28021 type:complete len:224 (-) Transcript_20102:739-1410(-)